MGTIATIELMLIDINNMTAINTTSIVNIIITAIMITSIIEMLSIENIKERQLCKTLCSYICDCQHIGDPGGQIVVVVIIVVSSRYVNWARLCVLIFVIANILMILVMMLVVKGW